MWDVRLYIMSVTGQMVGILCVMALPYRGLRGGVKGQWWLAVLGDTTLQKRLWRHSLMVLD